MLTCGCSGEEGAQGLGQKLGQGIGVGEDPDLPGKPARIGAQVLPQPLGLGQERPWRAGAGCVPPGS